MTGKLQSNSPDTSPDQSIQPKSSPLGPIVEVTPDATPTWTDLLGDNSESDIHPQPELKRVQDYRDLPPGLTLAQVRESISVNSTLFIRLNRTEMETELKVMYGSERVGVRFDQEGVTFNINGASYTLFYEVDYVVNNNYSNNGFVYINPLNLNEKVGDKVVPEESNIPAVADIILTNPQLASRLGIEALVQVTTEKGADKLFEELQERERFEFLQGVWDQTFGRSELSEVQEGRISRMDELVAATLNASLADISGIEIGDGGALTLRRMIFSALYMNCEEFYSKGLLAISEDGTFDQSSLDLIVGKLLAGLGSYISSAANDDIRKMSELSGSIAELTIATKKHAVTVDGEDIEFDFLETFRKDGYLCFGSGIGACIAYAQSLVNAINMQNSPYPNFQQTFDEALALGLVRLDAETGTLVVNTDIKVDGQLWIDQTQAICHTDDTLKHAIETINLGMGYRDAFGFVIFKRKDPDAKAPEVIDMTGITF